MVKVIKKLKTTAIYVATICFLAFPFTTNAFGYKELKCLVDVTYHESRGEGKQGQLAVIFTVLNRTKDGRFPDTPCKVVTQPNQFEGFNQRKRVQDQKVYNEIELLTKEVINGKHKDPSKGAVFFHTRGINPNWSRSMKCTAVIGRHKFFK